MSRIRPILTLLPLPVALGVLFFRLALGEAFFWGLPSLQFVPWRETALELLRAGSFPWWNGLNGAGAPLLANYQSALLYPLYWPSFLLPVAWSMSVLAVLHLFLAGWGMWFFTGALGADRLGQGVSALAFGLTSYLVARTGTFPMISTAAWLPWLLWAIFGLFGPKPRCWAALLCVVTALLLLAGHAQTAWYSLLLAGVFAVVLGVRKRASKPLVWAAAAVMVAVVIAASQLIPTAELLLSSQRGDGVERDFAMNFSYAPIRALNLLAPNVFGTPADGSYYTEGAYFEDAVYIGVLPLLGALAALVKWPWRRRVRDPLAAHVAFFGAIVVLGMVLALGSHSPVFPFLYDHVPTFDLFQAPVRWHLWTVFALSVLSAIGVTWWGRGASWSRRATAICVAALLVGVVGQVAIPASERALTQLLQALTLFSLLALLALVLTLTRPEAGNRWSGAWSALVLLLVAGDLIWANRGLNPTTGTAFYDPVPAAWEGRAFWPKATLDAMQFETHLHLDDYRMEDAAVAAYRTSGLPNLNLLDGADLYNNFDPLLVGTYAEMVTLLNAGDPSPALLRAAGVSAVVDESGMARPIGEAPLAWLVGAACWTDDAGAATRMDADDWNPDTLVLLAGEGPCETPADARGEVLVKNGDLTSIELNVVEPAWLVVSATYYPGWQAELDGAPVNPERANLSFRAVPVPAGSHTVIFQYRPAWLGIAAALSLIGLVVTGAFFALARREGR